MNNVITLTFNNQTIRAIIDDNTMYFVGKDVCNAINNANYRRALSRLSDDCKCLKQVSTKGGKQNVTVINANGINELLDTVKPLRAKSVIRDDLVIKQRIETLQAFKQWIRQLLSDVA